MKTIELNGTTYRYLADFETAPALYDGSEDARPLFAYVDSRGVAIDCDAYDAWAWIGLDGRYLGADIDGVHLVIEVAQ